MRDRNAIRWKPDVDKSFTPDTNADARIDHDQRRRKRLHPIW